RKRTLLDSGWPCLQGAGHFNNSVGESSKSAGLNAKRTSSARPTARTLSLPFSVLVIFSSYLSVIGDIHHSNIASASWIESVMVKCSL
ncbi:hypothetical protein, partial [Burkholderia cenocepacia]|uniref:hypothetical protein n=1 Tax=Burkholderia cenocepacia TaxID=95486 RepID=UPI001F4AB204